MSIGYSGIGRGFNASFPLELTLRPENKTVTCQSKVIIEGSKESGMLVYDGSTLIPLINYIDTIKWFTAKSLTVGSNAITIKAYDNIYHNYAPTQTINITRNAINISQQYKNYKVLVNGIDYSNYVESFSIDDNNDYTVSEAEISFIGNFMLDTNFNNKKEIILYTNDGFLNSLDEQFRGTIETRSLSFKNAEKITTVKALHKILKTLDTETSIYLKGTFNGDVQKELLESLGVTNLWLFNKYKYSGKRNLSEIKPLEIVKDIGVVQGEILDINKDRINMIPDEYLNYPLFEFTEDEVIELDIEENTDNLFNKINVIYGDIDTNNSNSNVNLTIPTTDIGYAFFSDEILKNKLTKFDRTGTVYFATWDKTILDFENITDARLILQHTNTDYGFINNKTEFLLDVDSENKIAFTEIILDKLSLTKNSKLNFTVIIQDESKKLYNPSIIMEVNDSIGAITANINALDGLFTNVKELSSNEIKLSLAGNALDENSLSDRNPNITYIKTISTDKDKKSIYEFLYRFPVDSGILSTLDFDYNGENNLVSYVVNAEIVKENNTDIFGKSYIRAITYAEPKTCYNRVKYIHILFRTSPINSSTIISKTTDEALIDNTNYQVKIKFKIFGKKLLNTDSYIDYENLKAEKTNAASITNYGLIDGGYLVNNYVSNINQVENMANKLVSVYGYPLVKVTLLLPVISELKKNIMIKVTSPNSGINNYYYINAITKNFDNYTAECYLLRTTRLVRNAGIESEYDLYSRNLENISLSPFLSNLLNKNKGLEKGVVTIAHRDNTVSVKVYGTNLKYSHIPSLQGLKPKKNDKVLIALTADNVRIVIAILERSIENQTDIEGNESGSIEVTDIEAIPEGNSEGFKQGEKDNYIDATHLSLKANISVRDIKTYWIYKSDIDITSEDRAPLDAVIDIELNMLVDYKDLASRITVVSLGNNLITVPAKIEAGAIIEQTTVVNGKSVTTLGVKKIKITGLNYAVDTTYEVKLKATDPVLYSVDHKGILDDDVTLQFTIEPLFNIQGIRMLDLHTFELILSHPLPDDFVLGLDNFLIVKE